MKVESLPLRSRSRFLIPLDEEYALFEEGFDAPFYLVVDYDKKEEKIIGKYLVKSEEYVKGRANINMGIKVLDQVGATVVLAKKFSTDDLKSISSMGLLANIIAKDMKLSVLLSFLSFYL